MKALAIVALVVSAISVVVPVFGATYLPVIAGVMALIAVREEHVLAFVALGINVVNVAFLSWSLYAISEGCKIASGFGNDCGILANFWTWMGINLVLLAAAVGLYLMNKEA